MKKFLCVLFGLCLLCMAAGCAGKPEVDGPKGNGAEVSGRSDKTPKRKILDYIDLTAMSDTIMYAELSNIIADPSAYEGKTIKLSGLYMANYYEPADRYCHLIIYDGCCQCLEFIWNGEHKYPDDYPEEFANIEITGVFEGYEEMGPTCYRLAVDEIVIKA